MPHVLGALDGNHTAIKKHLSSGNVPYNFKGFFFVILMALVDVDHKFI